MEKGRLCLMEKEYDITHGDLFAFQWRAAYSSPIAQRARRKVYLYLFLALLLISVLPAIGNDGFAPSRVNYLFFAVAFPVVALLTRARERRQTRRVILEMLKSEQPDKGQFGRHRLKLTGAGLEERTAVGESRPSWAGVDRVEQDAAYVFIYTSPAAAHVIPKRAFGGVREAESFYELARISREAAA